MKVVLHFIICVTHSYICFSYVCVVIPAVIFALGSKCKVFEVQAAIEIEVGKYEQTDGGSTESSV